ncbi:MAG: alanine--tRNA ligase [Ruminococcus sp.]|nr:alanine--tRNA ligase [Ruminococcus sp.]MBQ8905019.1 alanine--tRNA ligase [Ruminococcus sp.]
MKWTGLNELRERYLSFFESKSHTRMASASLIPQGDNSLLLINSGMAPLKKFFLGQATPPNVRVTTCQKCIRTPDIERVGKTARHGTYFEMLGNFSFGDYFKHEAIAWAWEFFTKELELPVDKLYVSVYEEDDEAYDIWTKEIGVAPDHMTRLGKADNFWEHGSGPCGPCSEIYFDRGDAKGCGSPDCKVGCECDRFVEVWNLVFSQFNSDGKGNYAEMEHKNIDTGMGLERLACVMQEVDNLFEVDTVQNIMKHICKIADVTYKQNEKTDVSLRVITDHIRSTTFMVGDGVTPANDGRGYVLKRLLRRAARHGKMLGVNEPFLYQVAETVINENKDAYPELAEKRDLICKIIRHEEESFAKTVDKGTELLAQIIDRIETEKLASVISGEDAFKLSDTYGFPLDLTIEIAAERGVTVDEDAFRALMDRQKAMARADRASKVKTSWSKESAAEITAPKTEFLGYTEFECAAKVVAIFVDGNSVQHAAAGEDAAIVLDRTPFYAESGGQISDTGEILGDGTFAVADVKKLDSGHIMHMGTVEDGSLSVGTTVTAKLDKARRMAIMRNHTAAHVLQAALRSVLGDHVHQAGQLVSEDRCRFDFSHFSAVTPEELARVEALVNEKILEALPVAMTEMPIDEARKLGAMALFGEKYGDVVRVVSVDGFSVEFCGGTHVSSTANLGLFRILSESSVAAGVRRIEAVTGTGVLAYMQEQQAQMTRAAQALKLSSTNELAERCAQLVAENREKDKQIDTLSRQLAGNQLEGLFESAQDVNGVKVISAMFNGTKPEMLRQMGDEVKDKSSDVVAVFAGICDDKGTFYCVCGKDAVAKGAHAGKIVQRVSAITGGKGGGRPDSAMAGIGKNYMVDEALLGLGSIVAEFVK